MREKTRMKLLALERALRELGKPDFEESELRQKQLRVNEQIHAMRDMAPGEWKVAKQQVG